MKLMRDVHRAILPGRKRKAKTKDMTGEAKPKDQRNFRQEVKSEIWREEDSRRLSILASLVDSEPSERGGTSARSTGVSAATSSGTKAPMSLAAAARVASMSTKAGGNRFSSNGMQSSSRWGLLLVLQLNQPADAPLFLKSSADTLRLNFSSSAASMASSSGRVPQRPPNARPSTASKRGFQPASGVSSSSRSNASSAGK